MQRESCIRGGLALACLSIWSAGSLSAQAAWTLDASLTSRWESAAVYDAARGVTLIHGGNDGELRNDTWQWNGSELTLLSPAHRPPAHWGPAMVYDSLRQRVVLFTGNTATAGSNQLWEWDGVDWHQLPSTGLPQIQGTFPMVYDVVRDRVVIAAGSGGNFVQLWEYDGATWTQPTITPANWPIVQDPILFAYDATAGNCALCRTNSNAGMWRWNGSVWSFQASPSTLLQFGARMVHDPVQQRLLLVGGQSALPLATLHRWVPATATWQSLSTNGPATWQHAACFDGPRNRLVVLGGWREGSTLDSSLWEWTGVQWERRTYAPPSAREGPALAIDRADGRIVLFGGAMGSNFGDTWHWTQGRWEQLIASQSTPSSTHPGSLANARLVHDEARHEFLLLRCIADSTPDLWRLNGAQWQSVVTAGPPPRQAPAVCYDRLRQRVLLFGGGSSSQLRDDLWQWDGAAWTQLSPPLAPQARTGAGMAYDELRDRVVLIGGQLAGGNYGDTWEFDGTTWTQFPAGLGPYSLAPLVCWDEARQAVIAVAGPLAQSPQLRTWQWGGAVWHEIALAYTPSRFNAAVASAADGVVLFGGRVGQNYPAPAARLATPLPAALTTFGPAGSTSVGPLAFEGTGPRPWLGSACTLRLAPVPPVSLPGAWLGGSRTSWLGTPLPIDLATIGQVGLLQVAPDVPLPMLALGTGIATTTIQIPATATLAGQRVFAQAFSFEPLAGAVVVSNGIELQLGIR